MKMNKKGAEMTIGTIVIIVLALIVLVILALGFSSGWSNLWAKLNIFGGTAQDLSTAGQVCQIACAAGDDVKFCKESFKVKGVKSDGAVGTNPDELALVSQVKCDNLEKQGTIAECTNTDQITCAGKEK